MRRQPPARVLLVWVYVGLVLALPLSAARSAAHLLRRRRRCRRRDIDARLVWRDLAQPGADRAQSSRRSRSALIVGGRHAAPRASRGAGDPRARDAAADPRARAPAALHPRRQHGTGHGAVLSVRLGIPPSLLTIVIVQIVWALPFATLIILTAMSTFDPVYLEAASMSGANRLRAFLDIELPLIRPGIFGAASFSLILSFNETIRTASSRAAGTRCRPISGRPTSRSACRPALYALMSLLIVLTLALVAAFLVAGARGSRTGLILERYDRVRREADGDCAARRHRDMPRRGRNEPLPVGSSTT